MKGQDAKRNRDSEFAAQEESKESKNSIRNWTRGLTSCVLPKSPELLRKAKLRSEPLVCLVEELEPAQHGGCAVWLLLPRSTGSCRWSRERKEACSVAGKECKPQVADRAGVGQAGAIRRLPPMTPLVKMHTHPKGRETQLQMPLQAFPA